MTLDEGKLSYDYTKAFQLLLEAVKFTNEQSSKMQKESKTGKEIFELKEKIDVSSQRAYLQAHRPILLPVPQLIITLHTSIDYSKIIQVFQNLCYIGELRQRWEEIKKLQVAPAI